MASRSIRVGNRRVTAYRQGGGGGHSGAFYSHQSGQRLGAHFNTRSGKTTLFTPGSSRSFNTYRGARKVGVHTAGVASTAVLATAGLYGASYAHRRIKARRSGRQAMGTHRSGQRLTAKQHAQRKAAARAPRRRRGRR